MPLMPLVIILRKAYSILMSKKPGVALIVIMKYIKWRQVVICTVSNVEYFQGPKAEAVDCNCDECNSKKMKKTWVIENASLPEVLYIHESYILYRKLSFDTMYGGRHETFYHPKGLVVL